MNTKRIKLASIFTVVLTAAVLLLVWPAANASARSVLPDDVMVRALQSAGMRGVDVRHCDILAGIMSETG